MIFFLNSEKDVLLYTCTCTYFCESKRGKKKKISLPKIYINGCYN